MSLFYSLALLETINWSTGFWDFDTQNCVVYERNEYLDLGFCMDSVIGWLLSGVEFYELGVPVIPLSIKLLSSNWDSFIPAYLYNIYTSVVSLFIPIITKWDDNFYHNKTSCKATHFWRNVGGWRIASSIS